MTLLVASDVRVTFGSGDRTVRAVNGVSLEVQPGRTLAVVGESGSGKSTLALALLGIHRTESGRIAFQGTDVTNPEGAALRTLRRGVQMILQDPYGSLDPRWTVARIIAEPLHAHGQRDSAVVAARVQSLLAQVGLPADAAARRPGQFSGGQRQRIAIARALALEPALVIADEPVSALDVSVQAQIVNLLLDLQQALGTAFLVISHDIALVHRIADEVLVMYLGRVVERGPATRVIDDPLHPYTAALVSAVPDPSGAGRIVLGGEPPSPLAPPSGCAFHPRCPVAQPRCATELPPLSLQQDGREVACHYPGSLPLGKVTG